MPTTEPVLSAAYDGLVCDLDGVVYRGPSAVAHAVEALGRVDLRIQYATNNASRPPGDVARHLCELGLPASVEQVATSAAAGAEALRRRLGAGAVVFPVGGPGVSDATRAAGLAVATAGAQVPDGVLQGYGAHVTADDLGEAAYAIQSGAVWVATNVDLTLPTDRGIAPGNGTLVRAVATACGREPDEVVGKPYAALYVMCARRLAAPPSRLLAVGDRLDTDIAGAVAAGMDSLLVLTGVSDLAAAVAAPQAMRPTFVAADLRVLGQPLTRPHAVGGSFTCGADRGEIVDGGWVCETSGTAAQQLTNRLHAAYAALDAGDVSLDEAIRVVAGEPVGG